MKASSERNPERELDASRTFTMDNKTTLTRLIQARYPIVYVVSHEEGRVLSTIGEVAEDRKMKLSTWSIASGLTGNEEKTKDPMAVLEAIQKKGDDEDARNLFVLKDFHPYIDKAPITRQLRELAELARSRVITIVITAPVQSIPVELQKSIYVMDWNLPGQDEIREVAKAIESQLPKNLKKAELDAVTRAAAGLTLGEVENVFARSAVTHGRLDPKEVSAEKQQLIRKSGMLEFISSDKSLVDSVGGHMALKDWCNKRGNAFSEKARAYGLPLPKGVLFVGPPGSGKSLISKSVGNAWNMPTLRLDMGKVYGGLVGSSEENIRNVIKIAEACAPCVLWIDEIEKGISGQGSGSSDGGTSSRVFGTFLTWMQEKTSPVFVVATANDVTQLPPELLRKGRFDEMFFCDLPTESEREQIFNIHIQKKDRKPKRFNVKQLVTESDGFTGAEIEEAITSAMFDAFDKGEEVQTDDVRVALAETTPLSRTTQEKIEKLRDWAKTRCRSTRETRNPKAVLDRKIEMS
jgi:AAA+ superfamily predicted ATPase